MSLIRGTWRHVRDIDFPTATPQQRIVHLTASSLRLFDLAYIQLVIRKRMKSDRRSTAQKEINEMLNIFFTFSVELKRGSRYYHHWIDIQISARAEKISNNGWASWHSSACNWRKRPRVRVNNNKKKHELNRKSIGERMGEKSDLWLFFCACIGVSMTSYIRIEK